MRIKRDSLCCIFHLAALYRAPIYKLMDQQLLCDFYIVNQHPSPFKQMDYNELKGFKKSLQYIPIYKNVYWQKGALGLLFKPHKNYILTGEPHCISTWFFLLFSILLRKKTFLWTHGWYGDEGILKVILKKVFFGLSTTVLLYGDYARDLMIKKGFSPNKLVCIYNSLDYDLHKTIRANLKITDIYKHHFKNDNPVIVFIGRIQKVKKLDLLLNAMKNLQEEGILINLMIIGDDNENTGIHEQVVEYNLQNNVWFYGACYDESKIGEFIYNADVCVSPGNVGLTAIHSFSFGTPVITHNNFVNQMPEFEIIEPGVTGDFFKEDNSADLARVIKNWISLEREKRNEIRVNTYDAIELKYNPYYQVRIIKQTIEENE